MSDQPIINNFPSGHSADHDLLIKLDTKLDRAILDIKDLKDDTVSRITTLEQEKLDSGIFNTYKLQVEKDRQQAAKDFKDYKEQQERIIEAQQDQIDFAGNWVRYGLGAMGLLNFLLAVYEVYKTINP